MLDYTRQHAIDALKPPRRAVLVTSGPAGVQASEVPCQAVELVVYLLVPQTSDHLFNLEQDAGVTLLASGWALQGEAQIMPSKATGLEIDLLRDPGAAWCALIRVVPRRLQIRRTEGWGNIETYDLTPSS